MNLVHQGGKTIFHNLFGCRVCQTDRLLDGCDFSVIKIHVYIPFQRRHVSTGQLFVFYAAL